MCMLIPMGMQVSPLTPTCEVFLISLPSETLAAHLALGGLQPALCIHLWYREKTARLGLVIPNLFCPLLALVVFLKKKYRRKRHPRGFAQVQSQAALQLRKGDMADFGALFYYPQSQS